MFQDMKEKILECRQDELPFCTAACPFGLDVKDFTEKAARGSFDTAYKVYRNAVGFPEIVARLCTAPCKDSCFLGRKNAAIEMSLLETAVCTYAKRKDPTDYNIPAKESRIGIIGGGISGLACALRLAEKRYPVTVFEASDKLGGSLWQLIPDGSFLAEIQHQLKFVEIDFQLNTRVEDVSSLDFDVLYIATGAGGNDFGLLEHPVGGCVLGGSLLGVDKMTAISQGLRAVNPLEWWIKTQAVKEIEGLPGTDLVMLDYLLPDAPAVQPSQNMEYTADEAIAEAKRCFQCGCNYCIRKCDLMQYYRKPPKRLDKEVDLTVYPKNVDGAGNMYRKVISSCNQCGWCKEACPVDIDFGDYMLSSRQIMEEKGALPWGFHEFWLRDYQHAKEHSLVGEAVGRPEYVFFPGCQLGASDPRYVEEAYRFILGEHPATTLYLDCCGAPLNWAGKQAAHEAAAAEIRARWEAWGKPKFIFACTTCRRMFNDYLPEIEGFYLYEMAGLQGLAGAQPPAGVAAVFDPCSSRHCPEVQTAVRDILAAIGYELEVLPDSGAEARCCTWGGHSAIAAPDYTNAVVAKRIAQSEVAYIAYCANCRDTFAQAGKASQHILDIIFNLNEVGRAAPTWSMRHRNRKLLRAALIAKYWPQKGGEQEVLLVENPIKLQISDEVREKISRHYILEEEAAKVVSHCEETGFRLKDDATGHILGHLQLGFVTYWVEYLPLDDGFELVNAYSHRMAIEGEEA